MNFEEDSRINFKRQKKRGQDRRTPVSSCFTRGTGSQGLPHGTGCLGGGRKNVGEATTSPVKPKVEGGECWLYDEGGKEESNLV